MSKKKPPDPPLAEKLIDETVFLKRPRKGAKLREEAWETADGEVTRYALAYINARRCPVDNGRVLGYGNSHGYHHRHFMGTAEPFAFESYAELFERFHKEVHELWRQEDESET